MRRTPSMMRTLAFTSVVAITTHRVAAAQVVTGPQATVLARKGAVQLKLEVLRTKIRVGESIWVRPTVKNIGNQRLVVTDRIFSEAASFESELAMSVSWKSGIHIPVVDDHGNAIPLRITFSDGYCDRINSSPWDFVASTEAVASLDINPKVFSKVLAPGESIVTPAGSAKSACPRDPNREEVLLGFTELPLDFNRPGTYRIKAVYDHSPETTKSPFRFPGSVIVETAEILLHIENAGP
jgi:hypothetical protein